VAGTGTTALVTGGGGFIGSHLVRSLLTEGHAVRILDNFTTGRRSNIAEVLADVELVEGDLQSYERVHNAVRSCDLVFHLGALPSVPRSIQDPLTSNATNVNGTLNVLLAARDEGVRRVVYASSSSVYGASKELPKREDMHPRPIAPYAVSNLAAEGYCRACYEVYGLETVALRYFNVFGPGQDPTSQYAAVIPNFITAVLEGRSPIVHGDGEQSRDFTYIDNAVEANVLAAVADGVAGETFNIACGERTSLNKIVDGIARLVNREISVVNTDPRPGDVPHSLASISKAEEMLGYVPKVGFQEGLQRTYSSYEELHREALSNVS
jgi:nucleoside-diphosphate-sugar epimerase